VTTDEAKVGETVAATRVVVAEDEVLIRLDLVEMLTEEGYVLVGQAGDGEILAPHQAAEVSQREWRGDCEQRGGRRAADSRVPGDAAADLRDVVTKEVRQPSANRGGRIDACWRGTDRADRVEGMRSCSAFGREVREVVHEPRLVNAIRHGRDDRRRRGAETFGDSDL